MYCMFDLGAFKIYYWFQDIVVNRKQYILETCIDRIIPLKSVWVFPYTLLYFGGFCFYTIVTTSSDKFILICFGEIIIFVILCMIFIIFPSQTPSHYRDHANLSTNSISNNVLKYVWLHDGQHTSFPSGHCAFSFFITCVMYSNFPISSCIYSLLVMVSCLFIKQHVIVDTIVGMIIGCFIGYVI
jgi:membrane-associated phospholipid phosphatase